MELGKRDMAKCSAGIGNWMPIMNFISFFAIPINMGLLIFARNPKIDPGYDQDVEAIDQSEQSAITDYLMSNSDKRWTRFNIVMLVVGVEHAIIGLKLVIAVLIPDVPARVKKAEEKRD